MFPPSKSNRIEPELWLMMGAPVRSWALATAFRPRSSSWQKWGLLTEVFISPALTSVTPSLSLALHPTWISRIIQSASCSMVLPGTHGGMQSST